MRPSPASSTVQGGREPANPGDSWPRRGTARLRRPWLARWRGSKHVRALKRTVARRDLRHTAEGVGLAVGVGDREFFVGRAGLFGRAARIERFALGALVSLAVFPDRALSRMEVEFSCPPQVVTVMYEPGAASEFDRILTRLRSRLR